MREEVPEELPMAEIGRSREFANCRSQHVGRLQKHESSPPAVLVVRSGPVGVLSKATDCGSACLDGQLCGRSRRDTAEAQQQQCEDEVLQPMIE